MGVGGGEGLSGGTYLYCLDMGVPLRVGQASEASTSVKYPYFRQ